MNEQIIILIFLVLALGATLWLYILKAKKQVEYKGDERWLTIQLKANQSANIANWTLIILLACLLYTSPSPRDGLLSRMPSSA